MKFYNKGDHAGSLPSLGVGMILSLYPVISMKCIDTSPPVPSRFDLFCLWNIKYLPFGDQAWSPNGRYLIFHRQKRSNLDGTGGEVSIHFIDITGYNERIIPTPRDGSDPAWSPLL